MATGAKAATDTAFAPRGQADLATFVTNVPQIGMLESKGSTLPMVVRSPRTGCGCQAGSGEALASGLGTLGVALLLRRRRR